MAQLMTVRLSRHDAQPWGFRLQGGKDFGTPLVVQKVAGGSLADQAGLIPGDAVVKVNDTDVFNLRHKDAQDIIVRSGNCFEVTIQRGGSTWRPQVTPVGAMPAPSSQLGGAPTVTRTSLARHPQEVRYIGSGYNNSARPYGGANGTDGHVKSIVNKQYNTPVGIYSEEAIAETLSAQAEVLAGGVLGVNFKKNEKIYNAANSEVLKMLHEQENDPEPADEQEPYQSTLHQSPRPRYEPEPRHEQHHANTVTRHVSAPVSKPQPPNTGGLPAGQNICSECERLIVGVFVRVKDKNLHVDCFKCATCGTSLKNQGYFNFHGKLYCDIHAKMAAMQNPPPGTEGYVPVPIKANQKLSASTISAALDAHGMHTNGAPASNLQVEYGVIEQPLQLSHSRTSSSSSSSAGTANSYISSLSPSKSLSPDKLSPAHSRQSSESGIGSGSGCNINTNNHNSNNSSSSNSLNNSIIITNSTSMYNKNDSTINHKQNENDMNSSNRRDNCESVTDGGAIGQQPQNQYQHQPHQQQQQNTSTYNEFLKEYTNKNQNGINTDSIGYKSSLPDVNDNGYNTMTTPSSLNRNGYNDSTGQESSIYGTIRPNTKVQPHEEFQYITLGGSVIRSVIPPGKGIKTNYKVHSGFSGPKPFNVGGPLSPQSAGPRSPSSYPPPAPNQAPSWSQPKPAPKPAVSPYATLPRTGGRYTTFKPAYNTYSKEEQAEHYYESHRMEEQHEETCYAEDLEVAEVGRPKPSNFLWPPPSEDDGRCTPTASPLYIPPPETQHVQAKPISERPKDTHTQESQRQQLEQQQKQQQQQQQWQSRSAPELTVGLSGKQNIEIESSSDSYTSTCTTTTTTSEEYQRMYQAQVQAYQMQQMYDHSGSEMDYHMDMEVAAMHQQQEHSYSSAMDYFTHSGRRSAQECATAIAGPISTYHLVDMVREVTPKPETPSPKGPRKVEFKDDVKDEPAATKKDETKSESERKKSADEGEKKEEKKEEEPAEEPPTQRKFAPTPEIVIDIPEPKHIPPTKIPNPVPKEWISPMVKALTTAPDKPVVLPDVHASECKMPCECASICAKTQEKPQQKPQSKEVVEPDFLKEPPPKGTFIASILATAPSEPVKFAQPLNEPVPLPEETEPYMPPPIDMKPYQREDFRAKSPLLNALITAPDRPFSPFGHDVCSQLLDLPTPKEHLTMVDALTTAPDSCYTPLNPERAASLVPEEKKPKGKQYVFLDQEEHQTTESIENQMCRQLSAFSNTLTPDSIYGAEHIKDSGLSKVPRNSIVSVNQSPAVDSTDQEVAQTFSHCGSVSRSLAEQHSSVSTAGSYQTYARYTSQQQQQQQQQHQIQEQAIYRQQQEQQHQQTLSSSSSYHHSSMTSSSQLHAHHQASSNTNIPIPPPPPLPKPTDYQPKQSTQQPVKVDVAKKPTSYQPGEATEMLAKSLEKVHVNNKGKFNNQAGQILTNMLEKRLALAKSQMNTNGTNGATNGNFVNAKNAYNTNSKPKMPVVQVEINKSPAHPMKNILDICDKPQTLDSNENSFILPNANSPARVTTTATVLITPKQPSDKIYDMVDNGVNQDDLKPSESVVYRNKPTNQLTTHAIDRRSYIEKDGRRESTHESSNGFGNGNGAEVVQTTTIAEELKDGKQPVCCQCNERITRGPFITALGRIWCPDHFICVNANCRRALQDIGFVEEKGDLYCEYCFEKYLAPTCSKCSNKIKGDCLNAIGKHFHPECFTCAYCGKLFGNSPFFLEEGEPYCEADWNELFTTKCFACGFPVEAGDKWVEALNHNYHSQCFNCTMCKRNLEGQSFFNKGGRPFCKNHAR